ncbi:CBS domain-containing protein [Streptomyces sp. 110]|uniref:CBS domain-containing protein n=1 Tax=Streptomyces endocoffeicus TaxID=2898945 RepID=A0ABS1PMC7_9ACTN|nr:CBS domain-containing protein [Streptomyces endocoffeicus]MBL1113583.1 CBS domain-containing protein [Streptomyces endocoffeicus]
MSQPPSDERLRELQGKKIPVSELLAIFGTRVRNDQSVLFITQTLKDAGLSTLPDFANCNAKADVHVVPFESVVESEEESGGQEEEGEGDRLTPGALPQQSFRIGDLPAAHSGVDCVPSEALVTQATYLMRTMNYSQVPVIDGRTTLHGVITWSSVAKMYETNATTTLANALVDDPPIADWRQDFFSLLPIICEYGYVLVRDNSGQFTGIVTGADITERFDATAWPFFVVGEIEFRLRKCLGAALDPDNIRAVQMKNKKTGQITDLMFNGYVKLLDGHQQNPALRPLADQNWQALGWTGVDRVQFVHQLDRVREVRNMIAHFEPEPLSKRLSDELRQFVGLLRQLT